jgi:creatinine amidohydrolase
MRFEELNWFDLEDYLKSDDRLIIVLGACEQHGYLSLLSDVKIPLALADAASNVTGVPVAPPLSFGASPYFVNFPGTLSLRVSTLLELAVDLVHSAFNQGFRRILILNGHGGNDPVRTRLYELANELPQLHLAWYAWWQSHSVEAVAKSYDLRSYHAGWIEAFPFTRVTDLPTGEKVPPRVPGLMGSAQARQLYGDGVFGGPYQVSDSIMNQVFEAALEDILQLLRFE